MGLFNHFPYPDTHQLNLDWILDAVKTCVDKVAELWTYVREPGAGIQKALTDAQAAATRAQTNATNAQASSANARTSAINAEANAANAQTSANDAQTSANDAQTSADDAQAAATSAQTSATRAEKSAADARKILQAFGQVANNLYPVGSVYVNYRNQELPAESDYEVIVRLETLTGGTWVRAGSHGQPVNVEDKRSWATVILGNAAGDANNTNFNIYVRTE